MMKNISLLTLTHSCPRTTVLCPSNTATHARRSPRQRCTDRGPPSQAEARKGGNSAKRHTVKKLWQIRSGRKKNCKSNRSKYSKTCQHQKLHTYSGKIHLCY